MSSLVIVAIPAENDLIWKISSEKVPHLTLMYLGEVTDDNSATRMAEFVEHALNVNQHGPFYLEVDYRGELGPNKADVLFFEGGWDSKWIKTLRGQLLQQRDIHSAYVSEDQYPEWVPHLTLGYPQTPAKPVPDDRTIYSVEFDRIAVWTGDYEGPEFRLKWPDRDYSEDSPVMAMSSVNQARAAMGLAVIDDDAVEHHGVKGMKWGVRKEEPTGGGSNTQALKVAGLGQFALLGPKFREHTSSDTKVKVGLFGQYALLSPTVRADLKQASKKVELDKADSKWDHDVANGTAYVAIHNAKAAHFNKGIDAVNAKHNGDFTKTDWENPSSWKPHERAYMKDVDKLFADSLSKAANELQMSNPSGSKKVVVENAPDSFGGFSMHVDHVKHAADPETIEFQVIYKRDAQGRVNGFEISDNVVAHSAREFLEDILEHHGVKGMKWGVRKDTHGRDRFDPAGHSTRSDAIKALVFPAPTNIPAIVRLGKRANQGTKAYMEKRQSPEEVAKREKRKLARKDFYWEMHAYSDISHSDIHNKVADDIDSKVFQLQSAPKYRGKNLKTDKKLADEYDQDVAKVTDSAYRRAVKDTYGVNPSGTKSAHYVNDVRGARIEIRDRTSGKTLAERELHPVSEDINDTVQHAATDAPGTSPDIMMTVKTDANGFITEIGRVKLPEDDTNSELAQANLSGEAFVESLLHYGIKGMRWGHRKEAPVAVSPTATSKVPHGDRRKTKVEVEGGQNHPAHPDALKAAEAQAKLKKSGAAALSNKDLQELQTRLNLERNVEQLAGGKTMIGKGRRFVRELTGFNKEVNDTVGTGLQTARLARQLS